MGTLLKNSIAPLLLLVVASTGGCATSAYGPRGEHSPSGYSETRLSDTRWRVEYLGASVDSRQSVERGLFHRAAEVTVQSGYEWFLPEQPDVSEQSEIVIEARRPRTPAATWRPHWRRRNLLRWTDWDPQGPQPAPDVAPRSWTVSRYSAAAEIIMGRGSMPRGAFDANVIMSESVGDR